MNNRLKKSLFSGTLCLLILGSFVGCGKGHSVVSYPPSDQSFSEEHFSSQGGSSSLTASANPTDHSRFSGTISPTIEPASPTPSDDSKVKITGLSFDMLYIDMVVGEERVFDLKIQPENADERVVYTSSDTGVVICDDGKLRAVAKGGAVVTVFSKSGGCSAACTVYVRNENDPPNSFRYDENGLPAYVPILEEGVTYVDFNPKNVKHLFTHCLVAYEDPGDVFYNECVTVTEFKRMIEQLYENNYILIDIDYMYEYSYDAAGTLNAKIKDTIKVPEGKKPIILSIDNVAYPRWDHGKGRSDRLQVVDGKLVTYTRFADGSELYSDDNEAFTILWNFVQEHPDFSLSGAMCVVAPSGGEGLFGWDTKPGSADYAESVKQAGQIVRWFNEHGFSFACHSYSHDSFRDMTVEEIRQDIQRWNDEVYPIVGKTHVFIYPYGSFTQKNSDQAYALSKEGFAVFCATSMNGVNWNDFPIKGNAYNERIILTSNMIVQYKDKEPLTLLFDPYTVYDNDAHTKKLYK